MFSVNASIVRYITVRAVATAGVVHKGPIVISVTAITVSPLPLLLLLVLQEGLLPT